MQLCCNGIIRHHLKNNLGGVPISSYCHPPGGANKFLLPPPQGVPISTSFLKMSLSISIFSKISLSISISIPIFFRNALSIFFKSVDISTIDIRYRYIEQG